MVGYYAAIVFVVTIIFLILPEKFIRLVALIAFIISIIALSFVVEILDKEQKNMQRINELQKQVEMLNTQVVKSLLPDG